MGFLHAKIASTVLSFFFCLTANAEEPVVESAPCSFVSTLPRLKAKSTSAVSLNSSRDQATKRVIQDFQWPITGPMLKPYGVMLGLDSFHGVNIQAPLGTSVYAAAPGDVVLVVAPGETQRGFDPRYHGRLVIIHHGRGLYSTYSHLCEAFVSVGERVHKQKKIGLVGNSGHADEPQLHFQIRFLSTQGKMESINPAGKLSRRP